MPDDAITISDSSYDNQLVLVPEDAEKDLKYRLLAFAEWLTACGRPWFNIDLAAYRDYLEHVRGLQPSSIRAHLSTIRARYAAILRDRDTLYSLSPANADPVTRKAFVDELVERIKNAVDPDAAPVKETVHQDKPETAYFRLTADQANRLMQVPGTDTPRGLRDTALIALMLCTGLREAELCNLDVPDLRQQLGQALALYVRSGKGCKARLIPYGDLDWVLVIVETWLHLAGIQAGPVFRGYYKAKTLREDRLTTRTVQNILGDYPLVIEGKVVTVKPHDLRRTYARRLYEAGVDLVAIQQNLGHADTKTTLGYIGTLDADTRKPPAVYSFDVAGLATCYLL